MKRNLIILLALGVNLAISSCQKSEDLMTQNTITNSGARKPVGSAVQGRLLTIDKYIILANKTTGKVELYHLTDLSRQLAASDLVWSTPVISGLSEVKRVNYKGQDAVLCTTNNGAIIYSYPAKTVLFHREITGWTMSIHSAEVLPDGNVVAVDSYGWLGILYPKGDPTKSANWNQASASTKWYALSFAHGAVWDKVNSRLYAVGYKDLTCYTYNSVPSNLANSTLTTRANFNIQPFYSRCVVYGMCNEDGSWEDGGHDLYPVENSTTKLWLSTGEHAFIFDMAKNPLPPTNVTVNVVLDTFAPMYNVSSLKSQQEAPTAVADKVILEKGGIKSLTGDPSPNGFVLAHSSPWFTPSISYSYNLPCLLYSQNDTDRTDVDLTTNNKVVFTSTLNMQFYKARLFY